MFVKWSCYNIFILWNLNHIIRCQRLFRKCLPIEMMWDGRFRFPIKRMSASVVTNIGYKMLLISFFQDVYFYGKTTTFSLILSILYPWTLLISLNHPSTFSFWSDREGFSPVDPLHRVAKIFNG